jgi:hypothetical protein
MGRALQSRLQPVRSRQQFVRAIWLATWGLLAGSIAALACALVKFLALPELAGWVSVALPLAATALGFLGGLLWRRNLHDAAAAVDDFYTLKDRAATALEFSAGAKESPLHALALADAMAHLEKVNPRQVVPLRMPRVLPYAVATFSVALILVALTIWNSPVSASPAAPLEVVLAQADRLTEEIRELDDFASKEKDPEIEKLVKELKAAIEKLKKPGADEREALAKLSEMQTALQTEQAKHNPAAVDAQLQAVGEALALADPLAEAGQALTSGNYEKAAQELEKAEPPELDRKTEKALREKLEQIAKQMNSDGQNSLSAATGEMSQGIGGDGKKFSEGSSKLAGEARKQGKRKKLMDLLKKQCNSLGECKCECEGNCNSNSTGKKNGKGGKKAGTAASGGELGEKTALFGNKKMEKITGKQSDSGETEIETTHSPEGEQAAQRDYRQNYAKYKKISESVLENEPIPLGHRQTIRRYFESIRPDQNETDQVEKDVKEK